MGLGRKNKRARPKPAMNVTPLVDVVLVLLIIFMVVLPASEQGVPIEVPGITQADEERDDEPYVLSLTTTGDLYLDEARVARGDLEAHLRAASRRSPEKRLVLRGDRGVPYAQARALFATCQRVGFPGVSLRAKRSAGDVSSLAGDPDNPEHQEQL